MRSSSRFWTDSIRRRALVALLVVSAVAAIGGSSARADNATLTVCASGCGYTSIQAAVTASGDGDTITVAAGTYPESGHVLIASKTHLTIVGAGSASTTVNTNVTCDYGCPSETHGIMIKSSHYVTLQGLTVIGPDAAHSGGGHGSANGIHVELGDHISLSDVIVESSARSNIDLNGADTVSLTNVSAIGTPWGNGINVSDTRNVTMNGVTTSGNAWGGIALYATGHFNPCGVANVSIAGASLGEQSALYSEIDNTTDPSCTITNVSLDHAELPYWVNLPTQSTPQIVYAKSLVDANAVAAANASAQPAVHAFADSVATLSALSLSDGTLSPSFDPATTSYTAAVGNGTTGVTVSRTASAGATVSVAGGDNLSVGANTLTVTVTSADASATRVYTVTVTRAAAAVAPAAPTTTVATSTTSQPTEAATVVNQPQSVAATPGQSGNVGVIVGSTAGATAAPGTVAAAPISVGLSWSPAAFTTPVTVLLTPQPQQTAAAGETAIAPTPVAGGYTVGNTVVQVNVTNDAGVAVTQFAAPLVIHISSLPAGQAPAYSHDGKAWTFIPELGSAGLPATQQDGYFVNQDGSIDIYTRHATLFGLLVDAEAPSRPTVTAKVVGSKLYLLVRAKDNAQLASYRVLVNGRLVKRTTRAYIVLTARPGSFQLAAVDAAGNVGKPSAAVVVVRGTGKTRPFRLG